MGDELKISKTGGVLEIILDRPKANAIDARTSKKMGKIFYDFQNDPSLRVAIITGAGEKFFSAGWDLKAAAKGEEYDGDFGIGGFGGYMEMHDRVKPVIAAINGFACGGGFELALAADIIVIADHAEVWLPEVFVGVIGDSACFQLTRRMPRSIAMEMLLTGRRMKAKEGVRLGLFNASVPRIKLMEKAREYAKLMVSAAPLAIAATIETTRMTETMTIEECYKNIKRKRFPAFSKMLDSDDAKEGPKAFAEKRSPIWKGK